MKLECSVEELKLLFKNFEIKEKPIEVKINSKEINKGEIVVPNINWNLKD